MAGVTEGSETLTRVAGTGYPGVRISFRLKNTIGLSNIIKAPNTIRYPAITRIAYAPRRITVTMETARPAVRNVKSLTAKNNNHMNFMKNFTIKYHFASAIHLIFSFT